MSVLTQGAQEGFTDQVIIKYNDLTETVSGTAETVSCFTIPKDCIIESVAYSLAEEFSGGSISSLNIIIGDDDNADGFIEANSVLTGATPISSAVNSGAYYNDLTTANTVNGKVYDNTATKIVSIVFTPASDALTALTAGKLIIKATIIDLSTEI